jgi:predicted anti-sigma-YlaC factor YlaD
MKNHPSAGVHSGLTCRDVTEQVSDYRDGRLPILTNLRVGLHLASCTICQVYMKQIALVSETVALLPKPCPSPTDRLRLRQYFARCHGPAQ